MTSLNLLKLAEEGSVHQALSVMKFDIILLSSKNRFIYQVLTIPVENLEVTCCRVFLQISLMKKFFY